MAERIPDRFREGRFGRDVLEHLGQPRLQFLHERFALGLAGCKPYLGAGSPDELVQGHHPHGRQLIFSAL
jgi:hypothetical protein